MQTKSTAFAAVAVVALSSACLAAPARAAAAPAVEGAAAGRSGAWVVASARAGGYADGFDLQLSAKKDFSKAVTLRLRSTDWKCAAKGWAKGSAGTFRLSSKAKGPRAGASAVARRKKGSSKTSGAASEGKWKPKGIVAAAELSRFSWGGNAASFSVKAKAPKAKYARVRFLVGKTKGAWSHPVRVAVSKTVKTEASSAVRGAANASSTAAVKIPKAIYTNASPTAAVKIPKAIYTNASPTVVVKIPKTVVSKASSKIAANAQKTAVPKTASTSAAKALTRTLSGSAGKSSKAAASAGARELSAKERKVRAKLLEMKKKYPEGTWFTNERYYRWNGGIHRGGYGCAAFAFELSDAAFGTAIATRRAVDPDELKVGDVVRTDNLGHVVIVIDVAADHFVVAEANYNSSVHWGRKISREEISAKGNLVYTRY